MRQLKFLIVSLFCCLCLVGCDVKHWPGFGPAKPVPHARVLIELPEPQLFAELYPSFVEVASRGGFTHSFGRTGSYTIDELLSKGPASSIRWTEEPNQSTVFVRRLSFNIQYKNREERDFAKKMTDSFHFVFGKASTEPFTKEEWQEFFWFYRDVLPRVFQDEEISLSISRHPAIFTDNALLLDIHATTDFEIPDRYLTRAAEQTEGE